MPLSAKVRVEVYLPDAAHPKYRAMLDQLAIEFTHAFGGCTRVAGLDGNYLSRIGTIISESVSLLYTDIDFSLEQDRVVVERYAERLQRIVFSALDEEAILVVVTPVFHAE